MGTTVAELMSLPIKSSDKYATPPSTPASAQTVATLPIVRDAVKTNYVPTAPVVYEAPGMSTQTKVLIGAGVAGVLGLVLFLKKK